jgi:hypothetical protein
MMIGRAYFIGVAWFGGRKAMPRDAQEPGRVEESARIENRANELLKTRKSPHDQALGEGTPRTF